MIYLDELLLTNFLAAAALLLGAGLLCARQCSGLRLMAGSAAAAAASLGILLPELPEPAAFLYKVFTCCAAVAAAYGVPGLRNFVQLCVWYLLLNLLLCGAVLLPGVQSANLCVYLPLSPGRLLLCCGAVLTVLRGVLFCFGRAGTRCFAAVLELEGAVLSVQAFCDTGFSVQDPLTGQAVVLVYYPAVRSALGGIGAAPWAVSLVCDGVIAGVGGVLTFLPMIAILFLFSLTGRSGKIRHCIGQNVFSLRHINSHSQRIHSLFRFYSGTTGTAQNKYH